MYPSRVGGGRVGDSLDGRGPARVLRSLKMGDVNAQLVAEYQGLVRSIATKVRAQLDLNCELDDLVAFGNQGLIEAIQRFDPTRGVQLNTFAYYRIRGAVVDGVRRMAYMPARIHRKLREAEAMDLALEPMGESRAASPEARADREATAQALEDSLARVTASFLMSAVGQGEEDQPETPEDELFTAETRARVGAVVAALPEREQALVRGFYFEGRQFDEVAAELGISKSWASRLHTKALDAMRRALVDP